MTRECEFPSFSPSSDETQQQEIRRWMYVNRWAIVNHDNSRDIYQSGLFPINSLFSIPRWKKSFGDGSSKGGRGASESSSRILHEHATSRARVFQVQRRRSLLEVEFFYDSFFSLSLFSIPGENALHVTPFPSGVCSYCCPIDVNRDIEYLLYTR